VRSDLLQSRYWNKITDYPGISGASLGRVVDEPARRRLLKDFLRTRREAIRPESAGLEQGRRRRTSGLRREEVATLARVGVTWYTWLEQGREIQASSDTLAGIARALQLSPSDESYLFALAGVGRPAAPSLPSYVVDPHVQAVLDGLKEIPALIWGPNFDALAFNRLADAVFEFDHFGGPFTRNSVWRLFMDPARRALHGAQWEALATGSVGLLRARHATHLEHPAFSGLLEALRKASPDFVRVWNSARTKALDTIELRMSHRRMGEIRVASVKHRPIMGDFVLVTLPPSDARTARVFARAAKPPSASAARRPSKRPNR